MPFDSEGRWRNPTDNDLSTVKTDIEASDSPDSYVLPQEVITSLNNARTLTFMHREVNKKTYSALASILNKGMCEVDIVIPVYGAINQVKACIESIYKHTHWPCNVIIVDDCSPDPKVKSWLSQHELLSKAKVLYNNKNRGFAATVNRGIMNGKGKYICVLNSDVIVTPYWLTKLVMAIEADPKNQIVNPATNDTAEISVPMQPGFSYLDMNDALENTSFRRYPEIMPTGFCFFFRRELINDIGLFDEGYVSYGEETDFWFKTIRLVKDGKYMGYRAVMADDCYLFHERGSSFSQLGQSAHMQKRKAGNERFKFLHPQYSEWRNTFDLKGALGNLRDPIDPAVLTKPLKYNIAWVVKSTDYCGGMKYIADIVNQLIDRGVNAKVVCIKNPGTPANINPPVLSQLHTAPIFFNNEDEFLKGFTPKVFPNGIVVAAVNEMVFPVQKLVKDNDGLHGIHHVQSYDPLICKVSGYSKEMTDYVTKAFGLLETVCSSKWIAEKLKEDNINSPGIYPGVDTNLFHLRDRSKGDDRPTVMVYMTKQYPYRGYIRGAEYCKELWKQAMEEGQEIRILAVGSVHVPECPAVVGLGPLNDSHLAQMLANEVDVFLDPSHVHSYGLPTLEALASGCQAVSWDNKGVMEYVNDYPNQLTVFSDNIPPAHLAQETIKMLKNLPTKREGKVSKEHTRDESIKTFINTLERIAEVNQPPKKILVVTPHLRKHGGPTTILNMASVLNERGNEVEIYSIYEDFNQELLKLTDLPINTTPMIFQGDTKKVDLEKLPSCDLLIVNSDNEHTEEFSSMPQAKKKILLKLSHNARFKVLEEQALCRPWDRIVTSTEWLRQVCLEPQPKWNHPKWNEKDVTRIGWHHYGHVWFGCPPTKRSYGFVDKGGVRLGILVHQHPLKGTEEAISIATALRKKYGPAIHCIGFGEVQAKTPSWFSYYKSLPRHEMAAVMKQIDIWISCSHTEGLGRLNLEAMSAGCAVISTDTGAEHLKDGHNCLLFPVGDAQAGGEAVDRVLTNKELFAKLVKNGYNTAVNSANPWPYVNNLMAVVKEVCE
jgi:GT2 family glycosyltransferase/glycosyltransferase involved in cell wall biosynthesis